nr:zinc finger, CCHC-type [Tanacetum cinerariifolium]
IAPVAIVDRQLSFEYTIASRSTDVMVMPLHVLNINHSAFRSMLEREKLFGTNFNDWFCSLKLVLRVEKKLVVIEQPLPAAPAADFEAQILAQWNAVYDAYNEFSCLILGKEGKLVGPYVIKMKNYVAQLERIGCVLPQDLSVGLIMNGLTSDFARSVRNYNMHNMGKTIRELHSLLIEYEKGPPKKATTPQVMAIQETASRILNMVPTKKVDKTPYELWYGKVSNLSYLKACGCEALVKRDTPDKLQQRSVKCIFIGYPKETMGYYFYFPPENKIVVERHA